jgi:AcrR family transcriptional regulator
VKPRDDEKINKVFSATLKLVEQMGVAGITMRQIAREAKLATGTLYIYFKDKDELINALFESCRKSSVKIYFKGYDKQKPFATGFKTIWMNIFYHRIAHFQEAVFIEQCYHSPFIKESVSKMGDQLLEPMYQLMERGKREKKLKKLDTFLLLSFMIGSMTEMVRLAKYSGRAFTEKRIEEIYSLCWKGMQN